MKHARLIALMLLGALGGCAAAERQQLADTEKLLDAAGFQRRAADSAERRQALASMPARRIVARRQAGKTVYTYADAQNCGCFYVGGPEAYAQYRELALSEAIAQDMNQQFMDPWLDTSIEEASPLEE
jgi:hypothetical protein